MNIKCEFKGRCSSEGEKCVFCKHNKGGEDHFEPKEYNLSKQYYTMTQSPNSISILEPETYLEKGDEFASTGGLT